MGKELHVNEFLRDQLVDLTNGLEYGTVLITVHGGRIVQIDRTEKRRFDSRVENTLPQTQAKPNSQRSFHTGS